MTNEIFTMSELNQISGGQIVKPHGPRITPGPRRVTGPRRDFGTAIGNLISNTIIYILEQNRKDKK